MYTLRHETGPIAVVASKDEATGSFTEVMDYAAAKLCVALDNLKVDTTRDSVLFYSAGTDPTLVHSHFATRPKLTSHTT